MQNDFYYVMSAHLYNNAKCLLVTTTISKLVGNLLNVYYEYSFVTSEEAGDAQINCGTRLLAVEDLM